MDRIKYWMQIFLLPILGISYLFPRDKKIWVFGSTFGRRFAENPRYLYLYLCQNHPEEIRCIWITHKQEIVDFLTEKGYEAYCCHSPKGIWYSLRAGVYIFDNYSKDIDFWLSGGALKVNLWHGSGNKKTNHDNLFDKVRHPKNKWEKWKTWLRRLSDEKPSHYTLATSEAMAEIYTSAFAADRSHILVDGQPRNDILLSYEECKIKNLLTKEEERLKQQIQEWKKENVLIGYLPTFRDSEKLFFDVMDLSAFNEYLRAHNYFFLTKLHPKSKLKAVFEEISYSNIANAEAEIDLYSFLGEVDLLVTDYSSVYTDFMLLNRPVVAFQFDEAEYTSDTRDYYIDQDTYMPERKAFTMQELEKEIVDVLREDSCAKQRVVSRNRMFSYTDGRSSERLYQKIREVSK